jgi:RNA polymerase sigma factor (sigma-70 family)
MREKTGVQEAFGVEDLLGPELGRVVCGAVGSVARLHDVDAENLIAEVQSELALKMLSGRFAGQDPRRARFQTFLAQVARNCAKDLLRRQRRSSPTEHADLEVLADRRRRAGTPIVEAILQDERRAMLEEAMESLRAEDPRGARILEARYLDGLPYERIAEEVGAGSPRTIHLWAHRAWRSLHEQLRKRGILCSADKG